MSQLITKSKDDDEPAILNCLRIAFAPYEAVYTTAAFNDTVLNEALIKRRRAEMTVYVSRLDGELVGTIGCHSVGDAEGHIRGMAVLPEYQSKGIASQLLEAAEKQLAKEGCTRITLDTTEPLKQAQRFYEKHGYEPTGQVRDFFGMKLIELGKLIRPI